MPRLEQEYAGRGYGDFKKDVADAVVEVFGPIKQRTQELLADPAELDRILTRSAERAAGLADAKLDEVYDRVGLFRRLR